MSFLPRRARIAASALMFLTGATLGWTSSIAPAATPTTTLPALNLGWQTADDAAMGLRLAWQSSHGDGALVAVLDSGADLVHPGLAPALWANSGEIPANGVDDDHDGYADDVHGVDLVNADGDPQDDNGHGTHVAGIVAGQPAEALPFSGVAPSAKLMVVKVLDKRGRGETATIAKGIRYAVAHGARIINLSLSAPVGARSLRRALVIARRAGALVVVAAGNGGRDLRVQPAYPASWDAPNVLAVAAAGPGGELLSDSGRGNAVQLAAPGQAILSTALGGGYELRSGTSMATPQVAGAAALIEAWRPAATWREIRAALLAGARPGPPGVRVGALDAARALAVL